ncbi:syntaxin-17-like isoform X1 [Sinocyclocheilus rhinocerous]|uniref:syntaxin-17-like isoform X1 n=1 Tax=Sinocyclocheilus rhinocerous TaxID=307959 RepID=UPI0007B8C63F|nr:PREDICTED: syntaxin-17-like isoform X1 [Sinocyclocheilus rhinocerous]XP_016365226.1 PREDICTED: syntaxin-17-like isoform X1 [Sinocyclocheilus rhinocerous]
MMAGEAGKLPLRRVEPPIQKFIKVAIPTDLERLHQHQHNIEKFQRNGQWDKLHQEHINSSRTVQQLRSNLREMEKLCGRVHSADAEALEKLVQPIRDRASAAIQEFLRIHSDVINRPDAPTISTHGTISNASETLHSMFLSDGDTGLPGSPVTQTQLLLPEIPPEQNAAESWDSLAEDLLELNGLVNEFSTLVHAQQEKIDSIEANVSIAAANVEEGTQSLGKAARSKLAVLPMAGAVVGRVLGGPLGLLAGFKVAGVAAAVGGGLLGFAGGNLIQRKRKERIDLQIQQIKSNNNSKNDTQ